MESSGSSSTLIIIAAVVGVALYLYVAYCLQRIAKNLRVRPAWFAWVPILNLYLWCKICGHGIGWTLLIIFIPILNIVLYILLCLKLANVCGRTRLLGILLIFPIIDLVVFWILATSDKSLTVTRQRDLQQPPQQMPPQA